MTALLVLIFVFVSANFIARWYQRRRRRLKKEQETRHKLARLEHNWSEALRSERVDGLSHMPEEWKSAIVPVRSETGAALKDKLRLIGKQIVAISTGRWCCRGRSRPSCLLELKKTLRELMDKEVEPFFASRNDMYVAYLLNSKKSETRTKGDEDTAVKISSPKTSPNIGGPRARAMSEGIRPWPINSNALFRQIMLLLRDLDNMFKASYNQRYDLRIKHEERTTYTEWMTQQLPQLLPENVVLKQNTSDLFEMYRQAAQVHSYYNDVCERIAKQTNAEWYPAPLKKIFRILEKAKLVRRADSVYFDCSKIFDIVRGTLIYKKLGDEPGGVLCGIRAIFDCTQLQIIRVKDRFSNPTSGCWRDVLFNARMVSSQGTINSHIVEVQLHQYDLREERMNVGGHFIYERHRALLEACEKACGSEAIEKLKDLHDHCEPVAFMPPRTDSDLTVRNAMKAFADKSSRVHPSP